MLNQNYSNLDLKLLTDQQILGLYTIGVGYSDFIGL